MSSHKQGLILLIAGFSLIAGAFGWKIYQKTTLSFNGIPSGYQNIKQGLLPKSIEINSVKINLPIEEGIIKDGVWTVSENGATHLLSSGRPGEQQNIVIYGHNKNTIMGPIRWVNIGDEIKIQDEEGNVHVYKVEETKEVSPNEMKYVSPGSDEVLTLYTCTGFLDSKRFIVIAKPKV